MLWGKIPFVPYHWGKGGHAQKMWKGRTVAKVGAVCALSVRRVKFQKKRPDVRRMEEANAKILNT